jgi:hypothetical protein
MLRKAFHQGNRWQAVRILTGKVSLSVSDNVALAFAYLYRLPLQFCLKNLRGKNCS